MKKLSGEVIILGPEHFKKVTPVVPDRKGYVEIFVETRHNHPGLKRSGVKSYALFKIAVTILVLRSPCRIKLPRPLGGDAAHYLIQKSVPLCSEVHVANTELFKSMIQSVNWTAIESCRGVNLYLKILGDQEIDIAA